MDPEELKKKMLDVKPPVETPKIVSVSSPDDDATTEENDEQATDNSVSIEERSMLVDDTKQKPVKVIPSDIEVSVDKEGNLNSVDNKTPNQKQDKPKGEKPDEAKEPKKQLKTGEKRIEPDIKFDEEQKEANKVKDAEKIESTATVEYSADPLPDHSQKNSKKTREAMQQPTVYDTKEYYLPIKELHHGHGSKKQAIVFGIIFAAIIVAAAVFYLATVKQ